MVGLDAFANAQFEKFEKQAAALNPGAEDEVDCPDAVDQVEGLSWCVLKINILGLLVQQDIPADAAECLLFWLLMQAFALVKGIDFKRGNRKTIAKRLKKAENIDEGAIDWKLVDDIIMGVGIDREADGTDREQESDNRFDNGDKPWDDWKNVTSRERDILRKLALRKYLRYVTDEAGAGKSCSRGLSDRLCKITIQFHHETDPPRRGRRMGVASFW